MGLIGGLLGESDPTLKIVPLDSGTQNLITGQQTRAGQTDAQLGQQANAGVSQSGQQMQQSDQSLKQEAAGSGSDPAMLQAIRNQYGQKAGSGIQDLMAKNQNNTAMVRANMLQQAAHSQVAKQQVETQNYENLTNAMNQAEMARAGVLSSIFGAVGVGAGMYLGSRGSSGKRAPGANGAPTGVEGGSYNQGQTTAMNE